MRFLMLSVFSFLVLTSCASKKMETLRVQDRIASEQVRTLKEVQHHVEMILEAHPELSIETKSKLKRCINESLEKQQLLKDEESKVIHILLSKSLRVNQLTDVERKEKKEMKKKLVSIYKSKAENIFSLVSHIIDLSDNNEINKSVEDDIQLLIRGLR